MLGKLIVIEGLDGCGKNTQTKLLINHLEKENKKVRYISFPNYSSSSSALIKMYLNSEFGNNPNDINAYAASSFYAVDRFASFKQDWSKDYFDGSIIVCDRYTTSNAFYQMCKLDEKLWDEYLTWLYDYEYNKLGIPRPDKVIYLSAEIKTSQVLMENRYCGDNTKKDLHESNISFLEKCEIAANYVAEKDKWHILKCCKGGNMRNKLDIHNDIIKILEGGT